MLHTHTQVNDSKGDFESHRDLHENIGCGHIGLIGFAALMGDPRLDDLPFILETPDVRPSVCLPAHPLMDELKSPYMMLCRSRRTMRTTKWRSSFYTN